MAVADWIFLHGEPKYDGAIRFGLDAGTIKFQQLVNGAWSGDDGTGTPTTEWTFVHGRAGMEYAVRFRLNAGALEFQQFYNGVFAGDGVSGLTPTTDWVFLYGEPKWPNALRFRLNAGIPEYGFFTGGAWIDTSAAPALIPLYSRVVFYGDGIASEGAAPGLRNACSHFLILMAGRVRPAVGYMQCKSGGDMDTIYARRNQAIKQQPEIFFFMSQGHNDGIMSSDYAAQMVKWERNLDACIDGLDDDVTIVVCTKVKSNVSGETTGGDWQTTVNTAQKAAIAARQALHGSRIVLCDTYAAYSDPTNMSPSSDANRVHPDERGGYAIGLEMFNTMDALVESETKENILADIGAKAWRSANIHPDNTFSGTGGTKSGTVAPTGNWPTGQRITNNLTNGASVAVACTTDSSTATAELSGTPASENSITMDDTSSISLTGLVKGAFYEWRQGILIDDGADGAAGIENIAMVLGSFGTLGSTSSAAAVNSAPYSRKIDTVLSAVGCSFGATQPPSVNPQLAVRYRAAAQDSRIQISKPALFHIEKEPYAPFYYIGDDGIFGTNFTARATGTGISGSNITAATVATITLEPGVWAGGASDWSTVYTRVMKINGSVVSGAFSAGWTYNAAGTLTAGQTVTFEITGDNGLGSHTVTLTFTVV